MTGAYGMLTYNIYNFFDGTKETLFVFLPSVAARKRRGAVSSASCPQTPAKRLTGCRASPNALSEAASLCFLPNRVVTLD